MIHLENVNRLDIWVTKWNHKFLKVVLWTNNQPFHLFQITDLNLDNCRATQIAGLKSDFKNLESLSLINVGLTTLKGFPSLPSLRKVCALFILI